MLLRRSLLVFALSGLVSAAAVAAGVGLTPERVEEEARAILCQMMSYYLSARQANTRVYNTPDTHERIGRHVLGRGVDLGDG